MLREATSSRIVSFTTINRSANPGLSFSAARARRAEPADCHGSEEEEDGVLIQVAKRAPAPNLERHPHHTHPANRFRCRSVWLPIAHNRHGVAPTDERLRLPPYSRGPRIVRVGDHDDWTRARRHPLPQAERD